AGNVYFGNSSPSNNFTVNLAGNLTMSDTQAYAYARINLAGSGNQTLNQTAGTIYQISSLKTTGQIILESDFTVTTLIADTDTTFDINLAGHNFTSAFNQTAGTFTLTPSGTGEITFNGFTQSAGTFNASGNFTVNSSFIQSGGTFNAPSGNLYITSTFNRTGGDFNHNDGTVTFLANNNYNITTGGVTFYNLVFNKTAGSNPNTVYLYNDFTIANDLTVKNEHPSNYYYNIYAPGLSVITISGNLSFPSTSQTGAAYFGYSSSTHSYNFTVNLAKNFTLVDSEAFMRAHLKFNGIGSGQNIYSSAGTIEYGAWTVDKAEGEVSMLANLILGGSFNLVKGTFNGSNFNLTVHSPFSQQAGTFTNGATGSAVFNSNFSQSGGTFTAGGSLTINGTFSLSGGDFASASQALSVNSFSQTGGVFTGLSGNASFNSFSQSLGTFTAPNTMTVNGATTLEDGTFTAPSSVLTINSTFNRSGGAFYHNQGIITFLANNNYNITTGGATFYDVVFNKTAGGNPNTVYLYNDFTIANDLTVKNEHPSNYYYNIYAPGLSTVTIAGNLSFPLTTQIGAVYFGYSSATHSYNFIPALTGNFILADPEAYMRANLEFNGIGPQSLTHTAGTIEIGTIKIDKTNGEVSQTTPVIIAGTLNILNGTFSTNGHNLTASQFFNEGTLKVEGSEQLNLANDVNSGVVEYVGSSAGLSLVAGDTYYDLTISGTGGTFTAPTEVTVNNDFTQVSGRFIAPSGNLTIGGNFTHTATNTFEHNQGTVIFTATDTDNTITTTSAPFYNLQFNGEAGEWRLEDSLTVLGNLAITNGTLNLNGKNLNLTGNFQNQDRLKLQGSETLGGNFTNWISSGTVEYYGEAADTNLNAGSSYYNLTISGIGSFIAPSSLEVKNDFLQSAGTFTAPSAALTVGGNFTYQGGAFVHNDATVTFNDSSKPSTISGSTTFYNLTCTTPGKTLKFQAGSTQEIAGYLTLSGGATDTKIILNSHDNANRFSLKVANLAIIEYVDVSNSQVVGLSGHDIIANNSTNSANNDSGEGTPSWRFYYNIKYWVAATPAEWDNDSNWSTTSGGAGGASFPEQGDTAVFNGAASGNCILDADVRAAAIQIHTQAGPSGAYSGKLSTNGFDITLTSTLDVGAGEFSLTAGSNLSLARMLVGGGVFDALAGTAQANGDVIILGGRASAPSDSLNIAGSFIQSGGTFNSSTNLTIEDNFIQSGGTFNAPAGVLTIKDNFTKTSGTFNHSQGTVNFLANKTYAIAASSTVFNDLVFTKTAPDITPTLTLCDDFVAEGGLIVKNESDYDYYIKGKNSPTITVAGKLDFPITLDSSGDVYLGYFLGNFTINLGGNFIMSDADAYLYANLVLSGSNAQTLIQTAGTIDYGTWQGNKPAGSVTLGSNFVVGDDFTISSNTCLFTPSSGYQLEVSGNFAQSGGTFTACDNFVVNNDFTQSGGNFNGSANLTINRNFTLSSGGTFNGGNAMIVEGIFTESGGTFNAPTLLTIKGAFTRTAGTFNHSEGTVTFLANDSYLITTAQAVFNNVVFNKTAGEATSNLNLLDNFTISRDVTVKNETDYDYLIYGTSSPTIIVGGSLNFPLTSRVGKVYFGYFFNSFALELAGNFTIADADSYMHVSLTLNGQAGQALKQDAGVIDYGTWKTDKLSGSLSLLSDVAIGGDLIINANSGIFTNSSAFSLTAGSFTQSSGTFTACDNFIINKFLTLNSGVFNAAGNLTVNGSGFTQSGGTFNGESAQVTLNGFSQSGGTFNAPANLYIKDTFSRTEGEFNHNNGTVTFLANDIYAIAANSAVFNNVIFNKTQNPSAASLTIKESFTVSGSLTVKNETDYVYYIYGQGGPIVTVAGNLNFSPTTQTGAVYFGYFLYPLTVNLAGNFTIADADSYMHASLTLNGQAGQALKQDAGTIDYGTWKTDKLSGSLSLLSDVAIGGDLIINANSGIFTNSSAFSLTAG
ncbi:MAG: hypothetical protein KKB76_07625, partial [Candidatus Omnitrophica bacterium]|nr:hypothetical protein [Candidatus Omnitrophota bacterium]